ncbi:D-3-phosphoglycerate dehydrogenase [Clostridia bacterium]|nr:D-3-phosphoglycerate dehydrogenase [Clostridia bacterium]
MYNIQTKNKIAAIGLDLFDASKYAIDAKDAAPDAVIVRSASMLDDKFDPSLKAIARAGAGYNNIPVDRCSEEGIVVFNTPGANANAVKELAVAALLLASRDILGAIDWAKTLTANVAKEVEAGKSKFTGPELIGKTLGIIGVGKVGSLTANAGVALGMNVIGQDPYITIESAVSLSRSVKIAKERSAVFAQSDYIALHAPVTPETKFVVNKDTIAQMKDGVKIVNLSRADLVDDDAMAAALESGKVSKYVTDFPNEATLKFKNTISIPHLGASTPESEDNCAVMAVNQIADFLENGNIKNSVNFPELVMDRTGDLRLTVLHKNVKGVISEISSAFAAKGINIDNMTNRSRGENAYTICDFTGDGSGLVDQISKFDGVIRAGLI